MKIKSIFTIKLLIVVSIMLTLFTSGIIAENENGYELEEVVVLSRHNIRAPLSTKGSVLDSATPHTWFEWSSNASELSLRGGMLETAMGQYFRKWLISEGLMEENYRPQNDEIRFYANAKQRTIATAQYFSSGFLPVANSDIIVQIEYDKMDPVFTPKLTFVSDRYIEDATKQMSAKLKDLTKEYDLLMDVLDFKDSDAYKNGDIKNFNEDSTEIVMPLDNEPNVKGALRNATSLADALVLQYYEQSDEKTAAFGHELSIEDWEALASIKDVFTDVLYTTDLVSKNIAHPLLKEIDSELNNEDRIFSFLCGHDSNIASVLGALNVKDYSLPDAIEKRTPIGSKVLFEKWKKGNERFIRVRLVYDSIDQLRNISIHDLNNPPKFYTFEFEGLTPNEDGMYKIDDFLNHLEKAISSYDRMLETYELKLPKTGIE
ncbi:MAG: histidine-type phosphatase [Erysipelotrichaceae bacterium]|nr:histidine-type phosphatase [Erysipelotrichaceae bacterium]